MSLEHFIIIIIIIIIIIKTSGIVFSGKNKIIYKLLSQFID